MDIKKDTVVSQLVGKFTQYEAFHADYRDRFLRYYQYYRCYISKGYYFEVSKLVPYAFSTIMSILPRLVVHRPELQFIMNRIPESILDDSELSKKINSVNDSLTDGDKIKTLNKLREKQASIMNIISNYQWENIGGNTRLSEFLLNCLIYGTCIAHFKWDDNKKSPTFEAMLPFNFYPDPTCTHARDLKRCFRRIYKHKDDIYQMFKDGVYNSPLTDNLTDEKLKELVYSMTVQSRDRADMADRTNHLTQISADDEVEIIEYYEMNEVKTIIGRTLLVRDFKNSEHKELPFIVGYNYHTPGEFWGIGEVELIEQYIEDATDLRASRKENMLVTMNNRWIVDMTANVYMEDLISAPNQVIRADRVDAVKAVNTQPVGRETYMEEDIWRRDIMEITGQAEYFRGGRHDGGVETATAISSLADTAQARWNLKLINLNEYFLKPLGRVWIELNKKKLLPMQIRLDEKDRSGNFLILNIDNDILKSIKTDYDIRVVPGNNRTTTKEQTVQLLQILFQNEAFAQKVNIDKLLPKLLDIFDIPVYDVLKTDEEVAEEQRQMAEAQAQAEQANAAQQPDPRQQIMDSLRGNPQAIRNAEQQLINRGL
jgi:hypothetical protein